MDGSGHARPWNLHVRASHQLGRNASERTGRTRRSCRDHPRGLYRLGARDGVRGSIASRRPVPRDRQRRTATGTARPRGCRQRVGHLLVRATRCPVSHPHLTRRGDLRLPERVGKAPCLLDVRWPDDDERGGDSADPGLALRSRGTVRTAHLRQRYVGRPTLLPIVGAVSKVTTAFRMESHSMAARGGMRSEIRPSPV